MPDSVRLSVLVLFLLLLTSLMIHSDPDFFDDVLVDEGLLSSSERLDGLNRLIVAIEQYFQYVPCISW
jgi:hypothetical protein